MIPFRVLAAHRRALGDAPLKQEGTTMSKYAAVLLLCLAGTTYGQTLTVNKYPCSAGSFIPQASSLPTLDKVADKCTLISTANLGDDVVYFITIANNNPPATPITLTDKLPTFFRAKQVLCLAFNGASTGSNGDCSSSLPSGIGGTLTLAGLTVPTTGTVSGAGSAAIVVEVLGYFTRDGGDPTLFTNSAVGTPHVNPQVGEKDTNKADKLITVNPPKVQWDLAVDKAFTQGSGTKANTFHETLTVTNNSTTDKVVLDNLLQLLDRLTVNTIPLLKYTVSPPVCTSTGGSSCPTNLSSTPVSGMLTFTTTTLLDAFWVASTGNPAYIAPSSTITIDFDITFDSVCGSGAVSLTNEAFFAFLYTGATVQDQNTSNDHPIKGPLILNYAGGDCPGGSKTASPSSSVKWSNGIIDEVVYQIAVTNTTSSPITVDVVDQISKPQGTPPFHLALTSNPSCTPSSACGAATIAAPFDVADTASHQVFKVTVIAPPGGAIVTYKVKYTPLESCQVTTGTDTITNTAILSINGSTVKVASADVVMEPLEKCLLAVTKNLKNGDTEAKFGTPITYVVTYTNTSKTQPITIRTLRDVVSVSSNYAPVPIAIDSSSNCSPSFGATLTPVSSAMAVNTSQGWNGSAIVNLASPLVFPPSGTMVCTIILTPAQPTSGVCTGDANLVNAAYFDDDIVPLFGFVQPLFYAPVLLPLPHCRQIVISKTVDNPTPLPPVDVTFTIVVANSGSATVNGIVLTDPMPPGFTIKSIVSCTLRTSANVDTPCTTPPPPNPNQLSLSLDPLPGGAKVTIVFKVMVPAVGGNYKNIAKIDFVNQGNVYNSGGNTENAAQVQVRTPKLDKTFDPKTVKTGDQLSLIFTITNPTGTPTSGVQFTDNLPPGVDVVQVDAAGTTCKGTVQIAPDKHSITFSDGSVGADACQIKVIVKATGCSVVNRWSDNPKDSNIVNINNLDPTGVSAAFTVDPCAPPSGFVEVCKASSTTNPVTGIFTFTSPAFTSPPFTGGSITLPVGTCTGPIKVPPGTVTITEAAAAGVGVNAITASGLNPTTQAQENRLVTSDLPNRTATVTVVSGDVSTATIATFTNFKVPTGFVEVCKAAAPGATVTGSFTFNIPGAPNNPYTIPVGACSGPIPVQAGSTTITEAPRGGYQLVDVTTLPSDRLVSKNLPGGSAIATVVGGDLSTETVVIFFNDSAPGQLKTCKIAGTGIVPGQTFTISANGTPYTVPAGPASQGGFCVLDSTFPVGTVVNVQETIPSGDQVSSITVNPPDRGVGKPDLVKGATQVTIGTGFTEVTYTNIVATPPPSGQLTICKIAGQGVDIGTNFTFTATGQGSSQTYTVPAGPASQGGFCVRDGTYPIGAAVTIKEVAPARTVATSITVAPADRGGTPDLTNGSVTVTIGTGSTDVSVTNSASVGIATTALMAAQPGIAFSQTLAATGGMPPYFWQLTDGTLPPGFVLNPFTGEISGPPMDNPAPISVTFKVIDSSWPLQTNTASFAGKSTGCCTTMRPSWAARP